MPYIEIARAVGASTTTVTRVAHWLRHGEGGYRIAHRPPAASAPERPLRIALPSKGRLAEPAQRLLRDAGFGFEPDGRRLRVPLPDQDAEILFARADDIPVWTTDRRRRLRHRRREPGGRVRASSSTSCCASGSARCRLARRRPGELGDHAASAISPAVRIATSYPAHRRPLPRQRGVDGDLRPDLRVGRARALARRRRGGRRPRLQRRDAAPERPRRAGRPSSSPRPCCSRARELDPGAAAARRRARGWCSRSVLAARPKRYLMLNAHDDHLRDIARRCCPASTRRPCCRWRAAACTPCTPSSMPTTSCACSPAQARRRHRHPRPPDRAPDPMTPRHPRSSAPSWPAPRRTAGRRASRPAPSRRFDMNTLPRAPAWWPEIAAQVAALPRRLPRGHLPRRCARRSAGYAGFDLEQVVPGAGCDEIMLLMCGAAGPRPRRLAVVCTADVPAVRRGDAHRRRPAGGDPAPRLGLALDCEAVLERAPGRAAGVALLAQQPDRRGGARRAC